MKCKMLPKGQISITMNRSQAKELAELTKHLASDKSKGKRTIAKSLMNISRSIDNVANLRNEHLKREQLKVDQEKASNEYKNKINEILKPKTITRKKY